MGSLPRAASIRPAASWPGSSRGRQRPDKLWLTLPRPAASCGVPSREQAGHLACHPWGKPACPLLCTPQGPHCRGHRASCRLSIPCLPLQVHVPLRRAPAPGAECGSGALLYRGPGQLGSGRVSSSLFPACWPPSPWLCAGTLSPPTPPHTSSLGAFPRGRGYVSHESLPDLPNGEATPRPCHPWGGGCLPPCPVRWATQNFGQCGVVGLRFAVGAAALGVSRGFFSDPE